MATYADAAPDIYSEDQPLPSASSAPSESPNEIWNDDALIHAYASRLPCPVTGAVAAALGWPPTGARARCSLSLSRAAAP